MTRTLRSQKYATIFILFALALIVLLDNIGDTAVALALPAMTTALNGKIHTMQWVINGYFLIAACLLIFAGRLSELWGARKVLLLGIAILTIASAIAGCAHTAFELILARLLQGAGYALSYPMVIVLAREEFPSNQQGMLLGSMAALGGIALAIGPPFAGLLLEYLSWRAVFLMNIPIGIIIIFAISYFAKNNAIQRAKVPLDYMGLVLMILGLFFVMMAVIQTGQITRRLDFILIYFAIGLVTLFVFYKHQMASKNPLLSFQVLKNKDFVLGIAIRFLIQFVLFSLFFVFSLLFQNIFAFSPIKCSLLFLALTSLLAVISVFAGKWVDQYGYKLPLTISLVVFLLSCILFLNIGADVSIAFLLICMITTGIASAIFLPSAGAVIFGALPAEQTGIVSGFYYTTVNLSSGVGAAIAGIILVLKSKAVLLEQLLNAHINLSSTQQQALLDIASSSRSVKEIFNHFNATFAEQLLPIVQSSFFSAFKFLMVIWVVFSLIALILSFFLNKQLIQSPE